jgi:hypothetical protein
MLHMRTRNRTTHAEGLRKGLLRKQCVPDPPGVAPSASIALSCGTLLGARGLCKTQVMCMGSGVVIHPR